VYAWLPQEEQNDFTQPSSAGCHDRTASSPRVISKELGVVSAVTEKALPARR
jgi:hypothetical protein